MIVPEASRYAKSSGKPWRLMKFSALFSALFALLAVASLWIDGAIPNSTLVQASQILAISSVILATVSLSAALWHIRTARPDLRRPAMFLLVVTTAVLLAHLYVVNSPPAATAATVSGSVDATFGDTHIQLSSRLAGTHLSVRIANIGSSPNGTLNAIGQVSLFLGGEELAASNLNPVPSYQSPLQPQSAGGMGYPTDSVGTWTVNPNSSRILTVSYQYLTCYHVPEHNDSRGVFGCIMDESYYVPSSLGILSGEQCAPFAPNCNLEHPPLAKVLIAAGIAVFGINDLGFRVSEVIFGTLTVPLIFALVELLARERRLSYFATLVFACDPMFFVHSSAALIDVPAIFFSLLGIIFYLLRVRLWKVNSFVAAGIFFGLAALSKETALFALLALLSYELLFGESGIRSSALRAFQIVLPTILVFAGGLQLYDLLFTKSALPWFYQQVQFMLSYGFGLKSVGWCLGASPCPSGPFITPLNWITFSPPVSYLVVSVTSAMGSYVSVGYYGVSNPAVVWMLYLWIPLAFYPILKERRWRSSLPRELRFQAFMIMWFLWSYLPYLVLWLYGRVTYPFYFLPAMPALASGAAYFITRPFFPRKMAVIYLVAVFGIFFLYFPVKDFLPIAIRVLLRH